jgi:hypothetical protein
MKQQHPGTIRWLTGLAVSLIGWCLLLVDAYYGAMLFYVQERILFIIPALAEKVSIEELISDPERFDQRWVRVKGEIWRKQLNDAVMVPPGTGSEVITNRKNDRLGDKQEKSSGNTSLRPLPDHSFYMHNFSILGMRTVSVLELEPGRTVEIVGEFERKGYDKPHFDLVALVNPRQKQFWFSVGIRLAVLSILVFVFIFFNLMGKRIRRVPKYLT